MSGEATTILGATNLAASQVNYTVQNELNDALTAVTQLTLDLDLSSGDITFSAADWKIPGAYLARVFNCTGHENNRAITLPASLDRVVSFYNGGDHPICLLSSSSAVPVQPNQMVTVAYDGALMRIMEGHISVVEYTSLDEELGSSQELEPGHVYIVGTGTGEFSGQDGNFAVHRGDLSYSFIEPFDGQIVRTRDLQNGTAANPRLIYWDADTSEWKDV